MEVSTSQSSLVFHVDSDTYQHHTSNYHNWNTDHSQEDKSQTTLLPYANLVLDL